MKNNEAMVVILMGLLSVTGCQQNNTPAIQTALTTTVVTSSIKTSDAIRVHEIPAILVAKQRADLSFQLSGTLSEVMVNIGQRVSKNQPLMRLYNPNLDPNLSANLARQESVKAQINQVKRDVADLQALRKTNSASQSALERQETQYKDLIAQQKSIQAQIDQARANQSESILLAPFDGIVVRQDKQLGEFVQAGQIAMVVYQQDTIEVEVNITRALWENLKLNDRVSGVYGQQPLDFQVTELAQSADVRSHLMTVILTLNTPLDHAIGQSVRLYFQQKYQDVYQLPLEAVVDDGINQPYVFLSVNSQAVKSSIKPLYIDGKTVIFMTEKKLDDPVVVKGQSRLSAGMRLKESS